jgi:tetratricopeptide (TPR) repeat protein
VGQAVLALATAHRELANVLTIQQRSNEAMAELQRSSTDQAVEEYRLAAHLPANDPWIDVGVGAALRAHGDSAEALNAYRRAVGKAPSNITVRLYLANAYYEQGNLDDALRELNGFLLTSTIDRQDLASYHRGLGLILARIPSRAAEAADHLSESLRLDPGARQAAEIRKLLETTRSHRE